MKGMDDDNKYIRFDWAVKRMLRDKANFGVLEGLITVLLEEPIHIKQILESEGNQEAADDKFNRVDIKAENSKGEIIIVEIQLTRELYYLQRILYGVSKAITEHIHLGDRYNQVRKVYSISIVYFDLGEGSDYLYHGFTQFVGVHTHDTLKINSRDKKIIEMKTPEKIFPEYYIIRVNQFNEVAKTPLEEWIEYLKSGRINDDTTAPGLQEAKQRLQVMKMTKAERQAYDRHIDAIMVQNDVLETAKQDGLEEGREQGLAQGLARGKAEGLAQGLAQGKAEGLARGKAEGLAQGKAEGIKEANASMAKRMKDMGMALEAIAQLTGIGKDEIEKL